MAHALSTSKLLHLVHIYTADFSNMNFNIILPYLLMELSASWEAANCAATQDALKLRITAAVERVDRNMLERVWH
jgi:hypothetical protein